MRWGSLLAGRSSRSKGRASRQVGQGGQVGGAIATGPAKAISRGCETGAAPRGVRDRRASVWGSRENGRMMLECVRNPPAGGGWFCGLGLFFAKFAGGDPSFDGFDFFESSSVSFLGGVSSAEEGFDDFKGQFGTDDTGADA